MPNYVMGSAAKLYIKSTALTAAVAAGSFNLSDVVSNVKDVTISVQKEDVDITTRGSGSWTNSAPGAKSGTIKFQMQWIGTDAAFTAIRTAFIADTEVFAGAMDGLASVSGSQGLAGNFIVSSFEVQQPVKGVQMVDIELKPSSYTTWYVAV